MSNSIRSMDDFGHDHAGTHRSTAGAHERVDQTVTDADAAALADAGYVVIPDLLDAGTLELIRRESAPLLTHVGRNDLEGLRTKRVYSVMAKTRSCDALAEHPRVLCLLDRLLLPNYLLSMFQIIDIDPGEKAQILHYDDAFYPIARPRRHIGVATICAVDDFTADNGATVVIPGSHRWGDDRRPTEVDTRVSVEMSAGSALVMLGTTWHGGGANATDRSRMAVTCQYCEPWARTQENMFLAVPREIARDASPSLQRMLGYSIHAPFMGNVDGMSPLRVLG
jgi:ectoine hydroxylase-related dioxygenase (phytanoyl-CoA dioxygenase family)